LRKKVGSENIKMSKGIKKIMVGGMERIPTCIF